MEMRCSTPPNSGSAGRMAFLGQAGLVGDQIGQHFEAAGNFFHQFQRQMHQFGQHAIEADAHRQRAFPRLDMNVAGPAP